MKTSRKLTQARKILLEELRSRAVPADAAIMQAYMKSALPYVGVKTPAMRASVKALAAQLAIDSQDELLEIAAGLFRDAPYREVRHAAIDLTRQKRYDAFIDMGCLPLFEEFISVGAWWDLVDAVAPYRLAELLEAERSKMTKLMRSWSKLEDPWRRRASICVQLKAKERTDLDLLFGNIKNSFGDDFFFIRKGIGWALRELGKSMPKEVLKFTKAHRSELSTLSKREALRNLLTPDELKDFLAS